MSDRPTDPAPPPDPEAEAIARIEVKLDRLILSVGRHMGLLQEDRDKLGNLEERVAALEAIPPVFQNGHG